MDNKSIQSAYRRYAKFYDLIFNKILHHGRQLTVDIINKNAATRASVLEVGVGTGLSLPFYRPDLQITGIDLSKEMLEKARERVRTHCLQTEIKLIEMNAEQLQFPNDSFNYVVAMHVASVVANLEVFLDEIVRVCVPGGDIIIVNHFSSENKMINTLEKRIAPLSSLIGFQADFPISPLLTYPKFKLVGTYNTNFLGYWKLLHFKKLIFK